MALTAANHDTPSLLVSHNPPFAVLQLNRPQTRNTLSRAMLTEIEEQVTSFITDSELRYLIITGTDDVFCAGADLREIQNLTHERAASFAGRGQQVFSLIASLPQTTVAAINGYCMGGGLDLALACDFRCALPSAVFAHPGVNLGIITGWGGTQRLPRLIGEAKALEIILTAERVSAAKALSLGLIDAIGEDVIELARHLAQTKKIIRNG